MCHHSIIDKVSQSLSDNGGAKQSYDISDIRSFELEISFNKMVDLTHTLSPSFPTIFNVEAVQLKEVFNISQKGFSLNEIKFWEHSGTHIDAPLHFYNGGKSASEIELNNLLCPIVVIDVADKVAANKDYRLQVEDISAFETEHGEIPQNACVCMYSGWEAFVDSPEFRGEDAEGVLHFPGFHPDAIDFFLNNRVVSSIGVDTLSLDYGPSKNSTVHKKWLSTGRFGIECLANLKLIPPYGAYIIIGSPKIEGMTGGPSRIYAVFKR